MDKWLKRYVEIGRREKLGFTKDIMETLANTNDIKKLLEK